LIDPLVKGLTMTSSTLKTATTLLTLALGSAIAFAGSANIPAVHDAMIFGTSAGSDTGNASGKGPAMFAGADGGLGKKRSLVTFDLGTYIPGGVTIDVVRMDLVLGIIAGSGMGGDGSNYPSRTIRVYHLTTAWNEGNSGSPTSQTIGGTGGGYAISTGDTSWHYTSYNGSTWSTLGGERHRDRERDVHVPVHGRPDLQLELVRHGQRCPGLGEQFIELSRLADQERSGDQRDVVPRLVDGRWRERQQQLQPPADPPRRVALSRITVRAGPRGSTRTRRAHVQARACSRGLQPAAHRADPLKARAFSAPPAPARPRQPRPRSPRIPRAITA
jgi:hypothetical protein